MTLSKRSKRRGEQLEKQQNKPGARRAGDSPDTKGSSSKKKK